MGLVHLTQNAMTVLEKRYLQKDLQGNVIETPEELFRRVANNIAQADRIYNPQMDLTSIEEEFYSLMASLDFLPNSPTSDECRTGASTTLCLLCPSCGGFDGGNLRCRQTDGLDSEERWWDRLLLLQDQAEKRCGGFNEWDLQRPCLFHERFRYGYGDGKTRRNSKGGKYGHPSCGPPRYP